MRVKIYSQEQLKIKQKRRTDKKTDGRTNLLNLEMFMFVDRTMPYSFQFKRTKFKRKIGDGF